MNRVRIPLRSFADTLCKSKSREYGRSNVTRRLESFRTLVTINGNVFLGYGEESITKSLQVQIVDALRLGERRKASSLLLDLGNISQSLKADDFVYIFKHCARSPDPLFVMETWRLMEEKEIGFNKKCYFLMVRALCKGGYLEELAVWQQDLSAVHEIWKDYIKHYSLNIISLQKFIWSFTRLNDLKSACETLQHMVALGISGKLLVMTGEGRLYSSRLDIPIPSKCELGSPKMKLGENDQSLAFKFSTDTSNSNIEKSKSVNATNGMLKNYKSLLVMKVLRWSVNDLLRACAQARDYGLAEQLMVLMQKLGLRPSSRTYDGFVRATIPTRGFSAGMKMLKVMEERNMKPHASTLAALSVQCSRALELDLAETLLDQVCECSHPYPYNAFLRACDTMDQPERAVKLLAKMRQLKLQPDIRTYEQLFSLFGNVNAPYEEGNILSQVDSIKRIKAIEMDMAKNGVQHSHLSMKNLLKALGAEGMTRELLQYLHVAENLFCHTNTYLGEPIYNIVLHSLIKAEESHMAIEIFKNMKSCGFRPNAVTYNMMIDYCSTIRCLKSAYALVSMMLRDGFYPETMTYTALIKILLEYKNFDEALNLLDQASFEGYQPDLLLYNTILKKAGEKGRIDIMEFIIVRMHQDKVQPDPSTCHHVFSAYVDRGFNNTAMEALQVLSMWMISDEDSKLEEKKIEFEDDFVLSEDLEAESRILQVFKDSDEYLAVALLNLRWCAILGFPISWSPNQSQWVRGLMDNYYYYYDDDDNSTRTVLRGVAS
ncbi:hypothetical protein PTKIN_Ptkin09bG0095600 [Pterospermum kingtungense]